jgi:hypothetical protein
VWPGWPEWASAVAPHAVSWTTVGAMLASLVLMGVFRLLAEWQRRATLVALMRHAPGGTVVIQQRGLGGPPMWVWVGDGLRPPVVVIRVVVLRRRIAAALRRRIAAVLLPGRHRA